MKRFLFAVVLCACGDSAGPNDAYSIAGAIVARDDQRPADGSLKIRVQDSVTDGCPADVTVPPSTSIVLVTRRMTKVTASESALVVGATVRVWIEGGIFESCPRQAGAGRIEVYP